MLNNARLIIARYHLTHIRYDILKRKRAVSSVSVVSAPILIQKGLVAGFLHDVTRRHCRLVAPLSALLAALHLFLPCRWRTLLFACSELELSSDTMSRVPNVEANDRLDTRMIAWCVEMIAFGRSRLMQVLLILVASQQVKPSRAFRGTHVCVWYIIRAMSGVPNKSNDRYEMCYEMSAEFQREGDIDRTAWWVYYFINCYISLCVCVYIFAFAFLQFKYKNKDIFLFLCLTEFIYKYYV